MFCVFLSRSDAVITRYINGSRLNARRVGHGDMTSYRGGGGVCNRIESVTSIRVRVCIDFMISLTQVAPK